MNKKRAGIIVLLLCFCFCLMPCRVRAASTADAVEPISPEELCELSLTYCYDQTPLEGIDINIYKVAKVSADYQFSLTSAFLVTGLNLNGIRTSGEWNTVRSTLEAYIVANGIESDIIATTDSNGTLSLSGLETGLYFATSGKVTQNGMSCSFSSALISLPDLNAEGKWEYRVAAAAKAEAAPPPGSDIEIEMKVVKLWKGDEGKAVRPASVDIEIFRDGISVETASLSAGNNWSYSWSVPYDGADWTVVERGVPNGYTVTVEERGGSFILTNTYNPPEPEDPEKPPQTGDTANILLYILLMSASGCVLIAVGAAGKRKSL